MSVEAAGRYLGELCQSADEVITKWGFDNGILRVAERFAQVDLIKGAGEYREGAVIDFGHDGLTFSVSDVAESNGFCRLAELRDFLEVWSEARGWSETDLNCGGYIDAGWLLWRIWRERLMEVAGEGGRQVKYYAYATPNNPLWSPFYGKFEVDRKSVRISTEELVAVADRTFPARIAGWAQSFYYLDLSNGRGGQESRYLVACELADVFEGFVTEFGVDSWIMFLELVVAGSITGSGWRRSLSFTRVVALMAGAVGV